MKTLKMHNSKWGYFIFAQFRNEGNLNANLAKKIRAKFCTFPPVKLQDGWAKGLGIQARSSTQPLEVLRKGLGCSMGRQYARFKPTVFGKPPSFSVHFGIGVPNLTMFR